MKVMHGWTSGCSTMRPPAQQRTDPSAMSCSTLASGIRSKPICMPSHVSLYIAEEHHSIVLLSCLPCVAPHTCRHLLLCSLSADRCRARSRPWLRASVHSPQCSAAPADPTICDTSCAGRNLVQAGRKLKPARRQRASPVWNRHRRQLRAR